MTSSQDEHQQTGSSAGLKSLMRDGGCGLALGATPDLTINVTGFNTMANTCATAAAGSQQQQQQQHQFDTLSLQRAKQRSGVVAQQDLQSQQLQSNPGQTQIQYEDLIE